MRAVGQLVLPVDLIQGSREAVVELCYVLLIIVILMLKVVDALESQVLRAGALMHMVVGFHYLQLYMSAVLSLL